MRYLIARVKDDGSVEENSTTIIVTGGSKVVEFFHNSYTVGEIRKDVSPIEIEDIQKSAVFGAVMGSVLFFAVTRLIFFAIEYFTK